MRIDSLAKKLTVQWLFSDLLVAQQQNRLRRNETIAWLLHLSVPAKIWNRFCLFCLRSCFCFHLDLWSSFCSSFRDLRSVQVQVIANAIMLRVSLRNLLVGGAFKVALLELAMCGFLVCLFFVVFLKSTTSSNIPLGSKVQWRERTLL